MTSASNDCGSAVLVDDSVIVFWFVTNHAMDGTTFTFTMATVTLSMDFPPYTTDVTSLPNPFAPGATATATQPHIIGRDPFMLRAELCVTATMTTGTTDFTNASFALPVE